MSTFLGFYRCYSKQLLKFIINLDFEKTYVSQQLYLIYKSAKIM